MKERFVIGFVLLVVLSGFVMALPEVSKSVVTGDTSKYLCKGDINLDRKLNVDDLKPFVLMMNGEVKHQSELMVWLGDFNEDGKVNSKDFNGFKETAEGKRMRVCAGLKLFEKDFKIYKCKVIEGNVLCARK